MAVALMERNGRITRNEKPAGELRETADFWSFVRRSDGWLVGSRPFQLEAGQNRLELHAAWPGPIKLVEVDGAIEQRAEFFLGGDGAGMADFCLDEEAKSAIDKLLDELLEYVGHVSKVPGALETCPTTDWEPPPADVLAGWLSEAGFEPAIDRDRNLRLTLKRRGCDGQARIERNPGRLRFVLPLGRWENLDPEAGSVMQRLTGLANDRSRLARLAWLNRDNVQSCEAQIDLTGMPGAHSLEPCRQQLWRDMLRLGLAALELMLRQLGIELPVLAEPKNRALIQALALG